MKIAKRFLLMLPVMLIASITQLFAQPDMKENIALIKKNLAASKTNLKTYEWIETTTTFMKGEEKGKKQNQCYYSVDGKLTKVATGATTAAPKKRGIRGKIIANKKEEMAEYVKKASEKIQTYSPPDAAKLMKIFEEGKATIAILEPGKKFKISFPDYLEKGDMLTVSIDKEKKLIMAMSISTSVDNPSERVVFDVKYQTLPDGTEYASNTTLDVQAKELKIGIENSGFKKGAGH